MSLTVSVGLPSYEFVDLHPYTSALLQMLFVMLVSRFPVTVVVPCVNALQFVFTAGMGHLIGECSLLRQG